MSNELDDAPDDTVNTTDPFVVTDKLGNRLIWDENNATIPGFMHEIGEHCYRKQILVPFIQRARLRRPTGRLGRDGWGWLGMAGDGWGWLGMAGVCGDGWGSSADMCNGM